MNAAALVSPTPARKRIDVIASTLCAIHCAVTPFLLIALPSFGKIWSHPASHWGMALFVVPIAGLMMTAGYRRHRRKWVVGIGSLGILHVLAGAAIPYLEKESVPSMVEAEAETDPEVFTHVAGAPLPETDDAGDEPFVWTAGEELTEAVCVDS
ncbi:MAG: MerC domain-containing protein [Verrucomicrobiales bacterium]